MAKRSKIGTKAEEAAEVAAETAEGISPNPMTNLVIADLVLRSGGQLMRHAVERGVLGLKFTPGKAKNIVKGRSMAQTLIGTALARIATRSVPGALVVGGGMLAKTLFDRRKGKKAARAEGAAEVAEQADKGRAEG